MKKTFLLFAFITIGCNLIFAQWGGGPATESGEIYFVVNTTTQPAKPKATSYKFANKNFVALSANWSPSAPSGFKKYWKSKFTVTETREGSGTGTPVFESPVLNDTTSQAPPPTGNNGLQKGKVIDMTDDVEINKKVLKSLRGEHTSDNAYRIADSAQKVFNKKVLALDYEFLREDDWLFSEFIWREIDGREKFNQTFVFKGDDNSGDQRFASILLNSVKNDSVWAFTEDRFTERMQYKEIASKINGPIDTSFKNIKDFNGDLVRVDTVLYFNAEKGVMLDSIYKFRLKEQWIFDKESSRLYCRILGVCPIARLEKKAPDRNGNDSTYMVDEPLFWIYYPDLRNILAVKKVYNPNSYAGRGTWDALFEDHRYSGRIIKTSYDNPKSKYIQQLITNPLFRLLEGENIKTRIFNYEQSLWSY
jgi:gliding motility associated protien GldN